MMDFNQRVRSENLTNLNKPPTLGRRKIDNIVREVPLEFEVYVIFLQDLFYQTQDLSPGQD